MSIVFASGGIAPAAPSAVWALGTFDGVHLGHLALIREARKVALDLGVPTGVLTFDVNPVEVLAPERAPAYLVSLQRKLDLLTAAGADEVVVRRFEPAFASSAPADFVKAMLVEELRAVHVVVGYDYTFGHMGRGTPGALVKYGAEFGFGVSVVPKVELDGTAVSSTSIRRAVAHGDVSLAMRMLGRPHRVEGVVERGRGVGSRIGIPTANLRMPQGIALPGNGVYACVAHDAAGQRWPAVCNIGDRPTFSDAARGVRLEAHLVGASGDFYNQRMSVEFLQRLRPEQAFDGPDALAAQIGLDIAATLRLVGSGDVLAHMP